MSGLSHQSRTAEQVQLVPNTPQFQAPDMFIKLQESNHIILNLHMPTEGEIPKCPLKMCFRPSSASMSTR